MDVSFTGINNLYIGKKCYSKYGSYLNHKGKVKSGTKNYKDVLIKCNLTDDDCGRHLTKFQEALSKCRPCYQVNCINTKKPSQIKILMNHFKVTDGAGVQNSTFKINGYDIMLDEPQVLPLFTFMAKLTHSIASSKENSNAQRCIAKEVNRAIHNEAVNFIENIMPTLKSN